MLSNISLAILSPNANAYSETFIQAHKQLPFNIKYYFDGFIPRLLEGEGRLNQSALNKVRFKLKSKISKLSFNEYNLIKSLKKNKVNCILAEYGTTAADSLHVAKILKLPLIVHFHGYDATMFDFVKSYKEKYVKVFEYASAIIVVSKKMYQDVLLLGCPPHKMHLITYGPNSSFFKIQPTYNSNQFVSIGRFVDKKAPYLTLAAFKEVVAAHSDAKLVMVGDGPLLNTCINLTRVWNLSNNVVFAGALTPTEIIKTFEDSIAFLQHSVTAHNGDSEGTPVAVLEASAAGLPIIASRHAGIPDVIIDGETGLLFDELDVNTMAKQMLNVFENHELAARLGMKGKEHLQANFTIDIHLAKIAALIESAVQ
jgi:colanic acid/amylovoran biosynthesis glycosyltransferase